MMYSEGWIKRINVWDHRVAYVSQIFMTKTTFQRVPIVR